MKKIIILGNSVAGVAAIEAIRRSDTESEITLISPEQSLAPQHHLFGAFIEKSIDEGGVRYRPDDFFGANNVTTVFDKKITKIDFKRKRITTEDKDRMSYDALAIVDEPVKRLPDVRGTGKAGVLSVERFDDIKEAVGVLPITETVCMQADSLAGLHVACGLKKRIKEVLFVSPCEHILSTVLDREPAEIIAAYLQQQGVRIFTGNEVVEVLGDSDVKAVKLKTGKVIAVQLVFFGGAPVDMRLFQDTGLEIRSGLLVDRRLQTNQEGVFALGSIGEVKDQSPTVDDFERSLFESVEQGTVAGLNICGQDAVYQKPFRCIDVSLFDLSLVLLGETKACDGDTALVYYDGATTVYQKLLFRHHVLVGAVLINAPAQKDLLAALIKQAARIEDVQRQFFGVLQASGQRAVCAASAPVTEQPPQPEQTLADAATATEVQPACETDEEKIV